MGDRQFDFGRSDQVDTCVRTPLARGWFWLCALLAIAAPAGAEMVSVQMTGEVTRSDFATIGVDTAVTGRYTYDDALPPTRMSGSNLAYYGPVTVRLGFVDGSTVRSSVAEILVNNHSVGDEYGWYADVSSGRGTVTGAFAAEHFDLLIAAFLRYDRTSAAWDGFALPDPATILTLLPYEDSTMYCHEDSYGVSKVVNFRVTDLSVVPVPVPGAVLLGALGLGLSHWLLRNRKSSLANQAADA